MKANSRWETPGRRQTLDALLEAADVVTLHVPATPLTRGMIGAAQLAQMKPGAVLINASRGTVVDIDALVEALASKHLSGAAIDVFPKEPKTRRRVCFAACAGWKTCCSLPHVGGSTEEAQESIGREVADKLIKYSNNGTTLTAVNFPEVSLSEHPGKHRLLHIHRNQPGVLSAINAVFSEEKINIAGQYLQTNRADWLCGDRRRDRRAGGVLHLKHRLDEVPGTIRTRILY